MLTAYPMCQLVKATEPLEVFATTVATGNPVAASNMRRSVRILIPSVDLTPGGDFVKELSTPGRCGNRRKARGSTAVTSCSLTMGKVKPGAETFMLATTVSEAY